MMGTVLGLGDTPTLCTTAMVDTVRGAGNARSIGITTLGGSCREVGVLTADHGDRGGWYGADTARTVACVAEGCHRSPPPSTLPTRTETPAHRRSENMKVTTKVKAR